ncbi:MAG TPA: FliH/SctL family protein [Stellaceae bacterium]|jgi:flagellar assembly protein FliH|nr:FliH/SctL family protein [Stellaceae bacterium]
MSVRFNLTGATVHPYPFPALGDRDAAAEDPAPSVALSPSPDDDALAEADATLELAAAEVAAKAAAEFAAAREEGFRQGLGEGRERGYAAGFGEATKAVEARLADEVSRLAAIVERLGAPLTALDQPVEEAVAALALEVARCVIGEEVKRSREFLARLVREAIAKVPLDMGAPRVLLNPVDLDLVRNLVPEVEAGNVMLVGDDTIELGGALVVADGDDRRIKDRRWNPRNADGVSQVNLTLPSRWRAVMLALFDGEDAG